MVARFHTDEEGVQERRGAEQADRGVGKSLKKMSSDDVPSLFVLFFAFSPRVPFGMWLAWDSGGVAS